ncbi:hypothetical protein [Candidatus Sulfurimonas baltica]|uniref:Uncharacterized protein n=1 Tax=Candidatus Sulfurimonas baltica TaxID=2740404 RepID=A0A7S7RN18_9BACT|nr:hypothetical protein [Candidatus Sulfurimonas baltica]QOY52872.1 hypothetical protein HUE88_04075 [Candidatus Sulfurimonas baltica]
MIKQLLIILFLTIVTFATDMKMQNKELVDYTTIQNKFIIDVDEPANSQTLPKQIDRYTKLVNIKTGNSKLVYIYEIDTNSQTDEAVKLEDRATMKEAIIRGTCISSKQLLEANISLQYLYKSSRTKKELFNFQVNHESCFTI